MQRLEIDFDINIILVNDGSPREPLVEINEALRKIPQLQYIKYSQNRGKGHAIRHGVKHTISDYYIYTDIDFPYQISSLTSLVYKLADKENGYDAVIGTRDNSYYSNIPINRKYISKVLQLFNKYILRLKISDTQCGLKGFAASVRPVFLATKIDRFLFDVEFIKLLSRDKKSKLSKTTVVLRDDITLSKVGVSSLYAELQDYIKLVFR